MKINLSKFLSVIALTGLGLMFNNSFAGKAPTASANGRYDGLIQELTCPADSAKYGKFTDYGYWVWLKPTWYVWRTKVY